MDRIIELAKKILNRSASVDEKSEFDKLQSEHRVDIQEILIKARDA